MVPRSKNIYDIVGFYYLFFYTYLYMQHVRIVIISFVIFFNKVQIYNITFYKYNQIFTNIYIYLQ